MNLRTRRRLPPGFLPINQEPCPQAIPLPMPASASLPEATTPRRILPITSSIIPPPLIHEEKEKEVKSLDDREEKEAQFGLTGLRNLGNTCYMNSILQALSNLPAFREYLLHCEFLADLNKKKKSGDNKNSLTYQLYKVFVAMWQENGTVSPATFRSTFGDYMVRVQKKHDFAGFRQQDSQEALIHILDAVHEELSKPVNVKFKQMDTKVVELIKIRNQYMGLIKDSTVTTDHKKNLIQSYKDYTRIHRYETTVLQSYISWRKYVKSGFSVITELFTGLLHSSVTCPKCHNYSNKFDPFTFMPLEIPSGGTEQIDDFFVIDDNHVKIKTKSTRTFSTGQTLMFRYQDGANWKPFKDLKRYMIVSSTDTEFTIEMNKADLDDIAFCAERDCKFRWFHTVDIYDCINHFCKSEILDDRNKWRCDKCNINVNAVKDIKLWETPKLLICQLKRFDRSKAVTEKITHQVDCPIEGLNLMRYVSPLNQRQGYVYDLVAVSNHSGNPFGGHYFTYAKNNYDKGWHEFNDSRVSSMNVKDVITPDAYLLFYMLRQ
jgi:ubiquitin C-terminal hydrolase